MLRYLLLLATSFFLSAAPSLAQYNSIFNSVWTFNYKSGINFNSSTPTPFTSGYNYGLTTEGCATVCDSNGQILFYSNGADVFNRKHITVPSSPAVPFSFRTESTSQAALILPVIDSPHLYYLFSLQQASFSDFKTSRLVYCKVDMRLDTGYGDIVPGTKENLLNDSLSEKMIAITGNNNNIWLLVHKLDSAQFLAYNITAAGIDTIPVISNIGSFASTFGYATGVMKVSHNRRKIVINSIKQTASIYNKGGTELCDFDPATGLVSNCFTLDSSNSYYGAEFSPDNSKLYIGHINEATDTTKIQQFDLTSTDTATIRASKTQVAQINKSILSDLKLAPDGKIYFIGFDSLAATLNYSRYLACFSTPNLAAAACGYTPRAITLSSGTGMKVGFPNTYVTQDTIPYIPTSFVKHTPTPTPILIYPNPTSLHLHLSGIITPGTLSIQNTLGQTLLKHSIYTPQNETTIPVFSLLPGTYYLYHNHLFIAPFTKQ